MQLELKKDKSFDEAWNRIPKELLGLADQIKDLIFSCAQELQLGSLILTTKWGEASFVSKKGVTIRIAAYKHQENTLGIFFPCSSTMIHTCRDLFPAEFDYEKNRAILISAKNKTNQQALKLLLRSALEYHNVKQAPHLGMAL